MSEMTVPDGWTEENLEEHFNFSIGGTPSRNNESYWDANKQSENKWVSIKDIKDKYISETEEYISDEGVKNSNVKLLPQGTVIMSFKLTIGRLSITKCPIYTNEAIVGFLPKKNNSVDTDYLYYGLQSWNLLEEVDQAVKGATLNKEKMSRIVGLFPPLPEQQKIASILTSVDDVIEKTQSQINKLQDLKKGAMNELLTRGIGHTEFVDSPVGKIPKGWEVLETSNLFDFKNGLNKEKDAFGSGVKIVNYMDVYKKVELSDADLFGKVELTSSELERFTVNEGDVFFTRTSETPDEIGLSSVVTNVASEVCFSGFVLRARPKTNKVYSGLSGYLYRCNYIRQQIVRTCSYTTRALTNGTSLGKVMVAIPSVDEQKKIYILIKSIEKLLLNSQRKLEQTKSLKKSLMQDLLTGKVMVPLQ